MSHLFQAPTLYRYRLLGQRGSPSLALGDGDPRLAEAALVALLGQVSLWEAVEQAAEAAAVAAQQTVASPAAVEPTAPATPLEEPPSTPQEVRRRLVAMERYGATPHRLAARVGVSSEKLLRQEAAIRKRMRRTLSPAESRELLRRHDPVLGFLALADLVPAAKLERGIQELALEALARREALTRPQREL